MSATAEPPEVVARHVGANGVTVEIHDESHPYGYANLLRVRLRAVARVPGADRPFERCLERLGVALEAAGRVRAELLEGFRETTLPYLLAPAFPLRYAAHLARPRRRSGGFGRLP